MNRLLLTVSEPVPQGALSIRVWGATDWSPDSSSVAVMTKQYRHPESGTLRETHELTADDLLALPTLAQKAHKAMIALQDKGGEQ